MRIISLVYAGINVITPRPIKVNDIDLGFYPEDKFAVLIDSANLYGPTRALAFNIDPKR